MADNAYDLCPREQRLRVAAALLADGEGEIADACDTLLLALSCNSTLPPGVEFFPYANPETRDALCQRAARAAMAVLLEDRRMALPDNIALAYPVPPKPDALAGEMARFIVDAAPEIQNEADLRAVADGVRVIDERYVRPMRVLADRARAIVARIHAAGLCA